MTLVLCLDACPLCIDACPVPLATVHPNDPRVADLKEDLLRVLRKNLEGPLDLLDSFGELAGLVEADEGEVLDAWRAGEHSLQESLAEVHKYAAMAQRVFDK